MKNRYKVQLEVTYTLYLIVSANNSDEAIDEVEKEIENMDNYVIVNRSDGPFFDIESIEEIQNEPKRTTKKGKRKIR